MGKVKSRFFKYWSMVFENIIMSSMYTFEDFAALYSGPLVDVQNWWILAYYFQCVSTLLQPKKDWNSSSRSVLKSPHMSLILTSRISSSIFISQMMVLNSFDNVESLVKQSLTSCVTVVGGANGVDLETIWGGWICWGGAAGCWCLIKYRVCFEDILSGVFALIRHKSLFDRR